MNDDIRVLADWIGNAEHVAVLTGAGISVPSGIPDFRSEAGIYSDPQNRNVFDIDAFRDDPELYYGFARRFYPMVAGAEPNAAHCILANWQSRFPDVQIVTQNIDDLHTRAGSDAVHYIHGKIETSFCMRCQKQVESGALLEEIMDGNIPVCDCGGVFKPDVTFFGEPLPQDAWMHAAAAMQHADVILVVGSSLVVYPAAGLPQYRRPESRLAIINRDDTPLDMQADVAFHEDLISVFQQLDDTLKL